MTCVAHNHQGKYVPNQSHGFERRVHKTFVDKIPSNFYILFTKTPMKIKYFCLKGTFEQPHCTNGRFRVLRPFHVSTVFPSYQRDGRVNMKGPVQ